MHRAKGDRFVRASELPVCDNVQTVMGKQAFVNTYYLQSFMKTNTCPRGKKKLDCITSPNIQYLKKEKV